MKPGSIGIYLRGVGMGIVEIIPGVSGGTIAFITGIYFELVRTIRGLDFRLLRLVLRGRVREAWREGHLGFLALLGAGMLTGVFGFARVVSWLLEHRELPLWGFFFGLIIASSVYVARFVTPWTNVRRGLLAVGIVSGVLVSFMTGLSLPVNPVTIFFGGMLAICAWILPGVSGSFVMLVLGLYPAVVAAISDFDIPFIIVLAAGCATGLLLFSRFLSWLLANYYASTLALLAGFLAGSLVTLWPWRLPVAVVEGKAIGIRLLAPGTFAEEAGRNPEIPGVVTGVIVGLALVLGLELLARFLKERRGEGEDVA